MSALKSSFFVRRVFAFVLLSALITGMIATSRSVFAASTPSITGLAAVGATKPLLGERVDYSFTFVNSGADVGYSPFFDLALDTSGPDGSPDPDGFTSPSVSAGGLGLVPVGTITLTAGQTTYVNPFTNQTRPVPSGFTAGDTILVYQLPFGSFTSGQSTLVTISTSTSNKADVGTPLPLAVTPGFRDTDAVAPFTPVYGSTFASDATPELWRLTKIYLGPEDETATGPNYKRRYRIDVDIATGQIIDSVKISDLLPNTMQWTGTAQVVQTVYNAAGAGTVITTNTTGSTATTTTPGGTVVGNFGSRTGVGGVDASLEFEFFVPRDTTAGSEILPLPNPPLPNPAGGTDRFSGSDANRSSQNNASTSGVWNPIDTRDTQNQNVSIDPAGPEHTLEEQSIATQKTGIAVVAGNPNTAVTKIQPGQTLLRYTIDFQVSDYYAMNNIFLQDVLGDGQRLYLRPGFEPTLTVNNPYVFASGSGSRAATSNGAFAAANTIEYQRGYTIRSTTDSDPSVAGEGYAATGPNSGPFTLLAAASSLDGTTKLRFNISQELINRGLSGLLVGGEIANGGANPTNNNPNAALGAAKGTITYWVQIKESFSDNFPSGDQTVDQGDVLSNSVPLIQGNQLSTTDLADGTPTLLGTLGTDDTSAKTKIPRGLQGKVVYAINGVPIDTQIKAETVFSVQAGDRVTYKLTYNVPISSFEDMKIVDLPPLPVMKVGDATNYTFNRDKSTYSYANYAVGLAPDDTFFSTFPTFPSFTPSATAAQGKITTDTTKNEITFTFDDWDDIGQRRDTTISLLLTLPIGDDPFVSDLFLTNQMRVDEGSTFQDPQTLEDLRRIQLVQPTVTINKGVVGYRTTGRALGGFTFNSPANATANWTGGTISSATQASAIGTANIAPATATVDAGDKVRYAIVVHNATRADAYNTHITDQVQPGYDIPSTFAGLNLQLRRGDGTLMTLGTDYTLVSYDAATGKWEIEITDNYTAGNVNTAPLSRDDRRGGLSRGEAVKGVFDTTTGNPPVTPITNGSNTIVAQYDLTLSANVAPNQPIINTAKVTNLSASETGPDLTDPTNVPNATEPSDTATATIQLPIHTKTLIGTEITEPGNLAANQATIGEIVEYETTVTVPEGVTPFAQIVDTLDAGLAFVDVTAVSSSSALSYASGGLPTVSATPANTTITNSGGKITFNLGTITNSDRNDIAAETFTIRYRAVVLNIAANQAGVTRRNSAQFSWTSNATTLSPARAANVTLVEPAPTATKQVANITDAQGPATTVRADNNDTIEYTIKITNPSSGTTTAFDLSLSDTIPPSVASPTIQSATSTGTVRINGVASTFAPANLVLTGSTLTINPSSNIDMEPGAVITIVVRGTFTGATGQIIPNTVLPRWTSMDGTPSTNRAAYNPAAVERTGADGPTDASPRGTAVGLLNDYWSNPTANIEAPPLVRKTIVASSEASTTPATAHPTAGGTTDRATIGEVLRYRLYVSVGEGAADNFQVQDRLPNGMRFLNDGSARFGFVSTNASQIVSSGITGIAPLGTGGAGNINGNETTLAGLASSSIAGTFDDSNISPTIAGAGTGDPTLYNSGSDVFFRFGNLNNVDNDVDVEFVVIEFNALVENIAANQAASVLNNDLAVLVDTNADGAPGYVSVTRDNDGSGTNNTGDTSSNATDTDNNGAIGTDTPGTSNIAAATVVEPNLAINKEITATTGAIATYRVTLTNTGTNASAAHETRVVDTLDGTNLSLVANSVNVTLANGSTGSTNNSAGNTVDVSIDSIPVGGSATITYQANVLTTPTGTTTLNNTANAKTTSLTGSNGTLPFFGTAQASLGATASATGERDGSGGVNDYSVSDTERLGSLGDRVYVDANGNGVQDAGEVGIVGAPVTVRWAGLNGTFGDSDDSVITTTTGANGNYLVRGLPVATPGQYRVSVDSSGAPFTTFGLTTLTDSVDNGTINTANPTTVDLTLAAPNPRTQDFGFRGTASIGDFVWHDLNNNGAQDTGEPGIPNVQVTVTWHGQDGVLGGGDDVVYTAATNASGFYSVGNLPAGSFTIVVNTSSLPDNAIQTYDLSGSQTDSTAVRTLTPGENATNVDFGYRGDASIGDRVWYDVDGDGVQDTTLGDGKEPGISGVVVSLTFGGDDGDLSTTADNITYSVTTDANGNYLFPNLFGGDFINGTASNYRVTIAPSATYPVQTFDSDGLATTNESSLRLNTGDNNLAQDFGYRGPATQKLGDFVWEDLNGNGQQDSGEPGIVGASVELWAAGPDTIINTADDVQLDTTTTVAGGIYTFPNLAAGDYQVRFTAPTGFVFTAQDVAAATDTADSDPAQSGANIGRTGKATVAANTSNLTVDAGLYKPITIGDFVWYDVDGDGVQDSGEPGINGATVTVTWYGPNGVAGGGDDATYSVVTNGSGGWSISNVPPGNYGAAVTTLPYGLTNKTAGPNTFTLVSGTNRNDIDFGFNGSANLGDLVWLDLNNDGVKDTTEDGIGGVTVTAVWFGPNGTLGGGDDVIKTTTTAPDGSYTFANLPVGNYQVTASGLPAGVVQTYDLDGLATANTAATNLVAGQNRTDVDFGYRGTGSLGNYVWLDVDGDKVQDASEEGIGGVGVIVTWLGLDNTLGTGDDIAFTTTTDSNGGYNVAYLPAGQYHVVINTATLPGGLAPTAELDTTLDNQTDATLAAGQNRTDVDFGYRGTGSIGDRVWLDTNGDKVQDAGEPGIAGVTIALTYAGPNGTAGDADDITFTTVSGTNGAYDFTGLPAGTYSVDVDTTTAPSGTGLTTANDPQAVTLAAGEDYNNADFGFNGTGSLGNYVWLDRDGDRVQDTDEPGIADVKVTLVWAGRDGDFATTADNATYTTTTTDAGAYTFNNLPAGSFRVSVDTTTLPAGVTATYDLDATANSTTDTTLTAGQNRTDVDFGYRGTGSIGDTVWFDLDKNGTQQAGEPGLTNVRVTVTWYGPDGVAGGGDDATFTTTTNSTGTYSVTGLPAGKYSVGVVSADVPAGTAATTANPQAVTLAAGQNYTNADFGFGGNGGLGDRVWLDLNGDGVQDAGEPSIVGAKVDLVWAGIDNDFNTTGDNITLTTTTTTGGIYNFAGLPPGSFKVNVDTTSLPSGILATYDLDGGLDSTTTTTLTAGQTREEIDFGFRGTASLGDRVWFDRDNDGTQDAGEQGLANVKITVVWAGLDGDFATTSDNQTITTVTDSNGMYAVNNLPAGKYQVDVVAADVPTGTVRTNGNSPFAVTLVNGQQYQDADFGFNGGGSLGNRVWLDQNNNGVQDTGEQGLSGITLNVIWAGRNGTLGDSDDVTYSATTGVNGEYLVNNLPAGNYRVEIPNAPGLVATYDLDGTANGTTDTTLTAGQNRTDVDFGYRGTGSIGDFVWFDADGDKAQDAGEPGIPGVSLTLRSKGGDSTFGTADDLVFTKITDGSGNYTFGGLPDGEYQIDIDQTTAPAGTNLTTANDPALSTVTNGSNNLDVDFGFTGTISLGDFVWLDRDGDRVQDVGEPGIADATVTLVWAGADNDLATTADNVTYTATTANDGSYTFPNLPAGNVRVTVDAASLPGGMTPTFDLDPTADGTTVATLTAGNNRTDVDFGYKGTGSIGDRVWFDADGDTKQDAGEPGLANIKVTITWYGPDGTLGGGDDGTFITTTDSTGIYTVDGLPAGKYDVTVDTTAAPTGTALTTGANIQSVTLTAGQIYIDADFGFNGTSSLGDRVWLDMNGDGVQDANEPGLPNVTVNVVWAGVDGDLATTADNVTYSVATDASGNYSVAALPAGNYRVAVDTASVPSDLVATWDLDTVANSTTDTTLTAGQNRTDVDFGYRGPGSLGDRIWYDVNNNGTDDAGEPGLANIAVTVTWYGPDGVAGGNDDVVFTTTTDGTGTYGLDGMPLGQYSITVGSVPNGMQETAELDSTLDNTTEVSLTVATPDRTDVDFGYTGSGSISQTIWLDADRDGAIDPGENGISGVKVDLVWAGPDGAFGTADDVTYTTTTDANGNYNFDNLPAGNYNVEVDETTLPTNLVPTYDVDGGNDGTATVILGAGENKPNVNFGFGTQPTAITLNSFTAKRNADGTVQLQWETSAEMETIGFHILRSEDGTRDHAKRVTTDLVPSQGSQNGASYNWTDATAQAGTTYTYWLEEIEVDGGSNVYGPASVRSKTTEQQHTVFVPVARR